VEACANHGNVLLDLRRFDEALTSYEKAIELNSYYAEAYSNRGVTLKELKRFDEALISCDKAIELRSDYAEAYSNRGIVLQALNRLGDSLISFDRALQLNPDSEAAHTNRGNLLVELHRLDDALVSYNHVLALTRDHAESHWNKSLALLLKGDFQSGFKKFEWRWESHHIKNQLGGKSFSAPLRLGEEPLADKIILLYVEQGLGDSIQFSRYAHLVKNLGAKVLLRVPRSLIGLFAQLQGVDELIEVENQQIIFDYHCPLMSLPLAFKTDLNSIPSAVPYLSRAVGKTLDWCSRLGAKTKPRVGLVWSGNPSHLNDRNRSLSLKELINHLPPQFEYFSLQKDVRDDDNESLGCGAIKHYGELLVDFTDTAALCELIDIVVTVDTSVAHLAAALGKKTWIVLPYAPDWRWLLDRDDRPWYQSVRLKAK